MFGLEAENQPRLFDEHESKEFVEAGSKRPEFLADGARVAAKRGDTFMRFGGGREYAGPGAVLEKHAIGGKQRFVLRTSKNGFSHGPGPRQNKNRIRQRDEFIRIDISTAQASALCTAECQQIFGGSRKILFGHLDRSSDLIQGTTIDRIQNVDNLFGLFKFVS